MSCYPITTAPLDSHWLSEPRVNFTHTQHSQERINLLGENRNRRSCGNRERSRGRIIGALSIHLSIWVRRQFQVQQVINDSAGLSCWRWCWLISHPPSTQYFFFFFLHFIKLVDFKVQRKLIRHCELSPNSSRVRYVIDQLKSSCFVRLNKLFSY